MTDTNYDSTYTIKLHPTDNVVVFPNGVKRIMIRKLKDHGDEIVRVAKAIRDSLGGENCYDRDREKTD